MLSLEEIRSIKFKKAKFGGYNTDNVDAFLDDVAEFCSELISFGEAKDKEIAELTKKLNEYDEKQDSIKEMLEATQKLSSETIKEAKAKAEAILKEAERKSDDLEVNLKDEVKKKMELLEDINKKISEFRSQLLNAYKSHLKLIDIFPKVDLKSQKKKLKDIDEKEKKEENKEENKVTSGEESEEPKVIQSESKSEEPKETLSFDINEQDEHDVYSNDISPLDLFNLK